MADQQKPSVTITQGQTLEDVYFSTVENHKAKLKNRETTMLRCFLCGLCFGILMTMLFMS